MNEDLTAALSWAAQAWGRPVTRSVPLVGGITSTMLALTDPDGEQAVLRVMTREPWRRHGPELVRREADTLQGLARQHLGRRGAARPDHSSVPAPLSLAVETDPRRAGWPVHLTTHLPGRPDLARHDDDRLSETARVLGRVHAHRPAEPPRAFQSWAVPQKRVVPAWARDPGPWEEAFARLERPHPTHQGCFLHRDFHPGNLLWSGGRITGVVDWVETSWGPAALDVAHCRTHLALLHGPPVAARFGAVVAEDRGAPERDQVHWDVVDVVGLLPDPAKLLPGWGAAGRDVGVSVVRERLEEHLVRVLDGG